jgi:uncharacterized membrane protein
MVDEAPLTFSQRASDRVTEFCGSWTFVFLFSTICVVWVALNSILLLLGEFDPYPYIFLNLILTVVSTFQGPLIMMSQNRQVDRDRESIRWLHEKLDRIEKRQQDA